MPPAAISVLMPMVSRRVRRSGVPRAAEITMDTDRLVHRQTVRPAGAASRISAPSRCPARPPDSHRTPAAIAVPSVALAPLKSTFTGALRRMACMIGTATALIVTSCGAGSRASPMTTLASLRS